MTNRLQLGTMYYLVAIGLLVYAGGTYLALKKIERQLVFYSVIRATPAPTSPWLYTLFGIPVAMIGCPIVTAIVRTVRRRRPKHCQHCGRWIGDARRCNACGVASTIAPADGRGFAVLPPAAELAAEPD